MSELTLRNRQRSRPLDLRIFRRVARSILRQQLGERPYEISVRFLPSEVMARVNLKHLQHAGSTDVITFDYSGAEPRAGKRGTACIHGEICVCVDEAIRQAKRFRTNWQSEVVRYVIHGVLHLLGHDDRRPLPRRKMKRAEGRLLGLLAREFTLAKLARTPAV